MLERKLAFDPTPENLTKTLRKRYKGFWARIRDRRMKNGDFRCEICHSDRGKREWLDAHEVYSFPEPGLVKLDRIVFICKICHDAIHLERTRRVAGAKWVAEVEAHYCAVNGISADEMEQDFRGLMLRSRELRVMYGHHKSRQEMDYGGYQAEADLCERRRRKVDDDDVFEQYPDHECPHDIGHAD